MLSTDIVSKAKELGIYTIVTDWYEPDKSPAKLLADEYWNVSVADIDELVALVEEHNVEGIFTNYTDSYLPFYQQLCERTNLPCLATAEQLDIISNKDKSKQLCISYNIAVSKCYEIDGIEDIDTVNSISFPVLTKPVDNSGQRGIFVCKTLDELKFFYTKSLELSEKKKVLVEEYVQGDYVVMFYTIQNGKVTLSTMADKPVTDDFVDNQVKLPKGYILPSRYISLCIEKMLPNVQAFVTDLQIKNGIIGIEAVVRNNDIFVFEMQFRLGGMRHHNFVLKENGMDIMAMLIKFSLTGSFDGWDASKYDNPFFKHYYCLLNVLIKPDVVCRVEGLENARNLPQVTNFTQMLFEGDQVHLPGTVQQIFCKFSLMEDRLDKLLDIVKYIHETVKVFNCRGENIVMKLW